MPYQILEAGRAGLAEVRVTLADLHEPAPASTDLPSGALARRIVIEAVDSRPGYGGGPTYRAWSGAQPAGRQQRSTGR
jgi:hypothetical protein